MGRDVVWRCNGGVVQYQGVTQYERGAILGSDAVGERCWGEMQVFCFLVAL